MFLFSHTNIKVDQLPIPSETYIWIYEWNAPYWFVYFLDPKMRYAMSKIASS